MKEVDVGEEAAPKKRKVCPKSLSCSDLRQTLSPLSILKHVLGAKI
jgi:hypothetical protein